MGCDDRMNDSLQQVHSWKWSQTTGGRDWRDAGQRYACEAAKGGFCRNDQNGGRCLDYRVRFLCCRS